MLKIRFDLPPKKKILLFDDAHSNILKEITKEDFDILKVRDTKEIYFWILIRQIIFFDFKFFTYCKNYIKFVSPKVVITFIDTNVDFYRFKKSLKHINFIAIQNGVRFPDWLRSKKMINSKDLTCDKIFVFNKHMVDEYSKIIKSNYYILGNFKNNILKIGKTKFHNQFLLISHYNKLENKNYINFQKKLFNFISQYFFNSKKKLSILLKSKNYKEQNEEIMFYKKIFKFNCIFYKFNDWKMSYKIIDKFENIITIRSTLGYEAISRKKKIAIFSPTEIQGFKYNFGWPIDDRIKCNFFLTHNLNYNEVKRILNNVGKCNQSVWKNRYFPIIENQMFFNSNNIILKKALFKLT